MIQIKEESSNTNLILKVPKIQMLYVSYQRCHMIGALLRIEDKKPQIILDYNKDKVGVDTMDHLATNYSCIRNTRHWPMTLFFNMFDVGAIASYVMWTTFYPESLPKTTAKRKIFLL